MRGTKIQISKHIYVSSQIQEPTTFAFVSDIHLFPNQYINATINEINPDAVLVGGDFIQSKSDTSSGLEFLSSVSVSWPVFCSSGKEHDFHDELIHQIESTGAVFLRNQHVTFRRIHLGGMNTIPLMGKTHEEKEKWIELNKAWLEHFSKLQGYKLLLCHHPEYYDMFIKKYDVDLIVSGHAHGGQIRLLHRGLWAPGQGWFPKYSSGLYDERLLVGRGLGNVYRSPRINNRPEVLEIHLMPCEDMLYDKNISHQIIEAKE